MIGLYAIGSRPIGWMGQDFPFGGNPPVDNHSVTIESLGSSMAHTGTFSVTVSSPVVAPTYANTRLTSANDSLIPASITGSNPYVIQFAIERLNKQPSGVGYLWDLVIDGVSDTTALIPYSISGYGSTEFFGTISSLVGVWSRPEFSMLVAGDNIYAIRTAGSGTPDIASGAFPSGTSWTIYIQDVADDVWGTPNTLTVEGAVEVDTTPPVLTLVGDSSVTLTYGQPYTELGATWTDNFDGSGTATVGGDTVDPNTADTYVITYDYTDVAGNVGTQLTRTVVVEALVEPAPPTITLNGRSAVVAMLGEPYEDAGAVALTYQSINISDAIVADISSVNTEVAGVYDVTYDVSDGTFDALQVRRRVYVMSRAVAIMVGLIGSRMMANLRPL